MLQRMTSWLANVGREFRQFYRGIHLDEATKDEATRPGAYRDIEAFRQHIFEDYRFTAEACRLLTSTRLIIHNLREPVGGGGWYGPVENKIELQGIQDEAAVHEFAHAYADFSGFYTEWADDNPHWPTRNSAFRAVVHQAAVANDARYPRISFICREYEFGNPQTGFAGMFDNDPERFAGLASGCMGDLRLLPPILRPWYRGLFQGTNGDEE